MAVFLSAGYFNSSSSSSSNEKNQAEKNLSLLIREAFSIIDDGGR